MDTPTVTGPGELRELARRPPSPAFSPIAGRTCVVVQAKRGALKPKDRAAVRQWIRAVPCPVIGIASKGSDPALQEACDAVAADAREAATLASNIARNPLAAAVL